MDLRFFICCRCGSIVTFLREPLRACPCCCQQLRELIPNSSGANPEVHIPVFQQEGNQIAVQVGRKPHPMIPEHYIQWVALLTRNGSQIRHLRPGDPPRACFPICPGDEVEAVYAYCNLHCLWKS